MWLQFESQHGFQGEVARAWISGGRGDAGVDFGGRGGTRAWISGGGGGAGVDSGGVGVGPRTENPSSASLSSGPG